MSTIKRVKFNVDDEQPERKPVTNTKRQIKPAKLLPNRDTANQLSAIKAHKVGKFTQHYLSANLTPFQELYLLFTVEQHYIKNRVQNNIQDEFVIFRRWLRIKNPDHETPSPEEFIKLVTAKPRIIKQLANLC